MVDGGINMNHQIELTNLMAHIECTSCSSLLGKESLSFCTHFLKLMKAIK